MKPLLICVHIFYAQMYEELKKCLLNMKGYPYELYVTLVSHNTFLEKDIAQNFAQAHIKIVENKGFDVAPFVEILNEVDLDNYSYVLKLHTKRDMPQGTYLKNINMSGKYWREYLLKFFKNEKKIQKAVEAFEKNPKLGMLADWHVITHSTLWDPKACAKARRLVKSLGFSCKTFCFVAGTMFMCRAKLLKPIQNLRFHLLDFESADANTHGGGKAHALERALGLFVWAQGYVLEDPFTKPWVPFLAFALYLKKRVFHCRRTEKGFLVYKLFGISIYKRRFS